VIVNQENVNVLMASLVRLAKEMFVQKIAVAMVNA
jgi:hypothetical protein